MSVTRCLLRGSLQILLRVLGGSISTEAFDQNFHGSIQRRPTEQIFRLFPIYSHETDEGGYVAFAFAISEELQLILVRFSGSISTSEFIASASAICSHRNYVRGYDGLIDLTHVDVGASHADIAALIEFSMTKHKHGLGKWAVLVNSPASTAYAMLYQSGVTTEHPFSLFCTFEGASAFLGKAMDPESFDQALEAALLPEGA